MLVHERTVADEGREFIMFLLNYYDKNGTWPNYTIAVRSWPCFKAENSTVMRQWCVDENHCTLAEGESERYYLVTPQGQRLFTAPEDGEIQHPDPPRPYREGVEGEVQAALLRYRQRHGRWPNGKARMGFTAFRADVDLANAAVHRMLDDGTLIVVFLQAGTSVQVVYVDPIYSPEWVPFAGKRVYLPRRHADR